MKSKTIGLPKKREIVVRKGLCHKLQIAPYQVSAAYSGLELANSTISSRSNTVAGS